MNKYHSYGKLLCARICIGAEDDSYFEPLSDLSSEYLVHFTRLMEAYQAEEKSK